MLTAIQWAALSLLALVALVLIGASFSVTVARNIWPCQMDRDETARGIDGISQVAEKFGDTHAALAHDVMWIRRWVGMAAALFIRLTTRPH